ASAWAAVARGETPALPARSSSFRRWAHTLADDARTARRQDELAFWRGMLDAPALSLFDGTLDPARDVTGTAGELTLTLPAAVTETLLTRLPAAFHAGINDVLLTGLALAVIEWRARHGALGENNPHAVLVDVEGHGREEIGTDLDLSR